MGALVTTLAFCASLSGSPGSERSASLRSAAKRGGDAAGRPGHERGIALE
jgi:hypothetical protein